MKKIFWIILIPLFIYSCKVHYRRTGDKKLKILSFNSQLISTTENPPFQYGSFRCYYNCNDCKNNNCQGDTTLLNGLYWFTEDSLPKDKLYMQDTIGNYKNGYREGVQLMALTYFTEELEDDIFYSKGYIRLSKKEKGLLVNQWVHGITIKILVVENYKNGFRHGKYIAYNENGEKLYQTKFKRGTGYKKAFYPNGQLKDEGQLEKGLRVGLWKYYSESGELVKEEYL